MHSSELYAKARSIDNLADDVEVAFDAVRAVAQSPAWQCANATDVRQAVTHFRGAALTAAGHLRDEAARVRVQAREAEEREREHTLPVSAS